MPFRYAMHLNNMGHMVQFYVDAEPAEILHRPECLLPEFATQYPEWIIDLGWKPQGRDYIFPTNRLLKLIDQLNSTDWDAIVLCGQWLKLANYLKARHARIALLAGSDLDVMASYRQIINYNYSNNILSNALIKVSQIIGAYLQRRGIGKSTMVNYYPEGINPIGDLLLKEIMGTSRYERLQNRGTNTERIPYIEPSTRTGESVIAFCAQRFIWKSPLPPGYTEEENKRNDIMLKGISVFFKKTNIPIHIHLVEKGVHVEETKTLSKCLGIDRIITWHKEMTLTEIQSWYAKSDIILDQFGNHFLGGGALDSMLMGRPVIGKARNEVFSKVLGAPMPMCDAADEQQIADWLEALVNDANLRKQIGMKSREFMLRHFDAKDTAISILSHIDQVKRSGMRV